MVGHQALVILLAVIWGLASTVEQGTTAASEVAQLFHRRAYTSDMVYTVQTPVSALSKCAGHCTLSPTCRGLCYSTSTSRCYLNDKSASPAQSVVGDSGDMRCFAHGKCPTAEGYSMHEGICVKMFKELASIDAATSRCETDDAHLIHVKSTQDQQALQHLKDAEGPVEVLEWWAGADDRDTEGSYVWHGDGSPLLATDPLWRTSEPNGQERENCVTVHTDDFGLIDVPCSMQYHYVCQLDI